MFGRCLELTEERIEADPFRIYNDILERKKSPLNNNTPSTRFYMTSNAIKSRQSERVQFNRESL